MGGGGGQYSVCSVVTHFRRWRLEKRHQNLRQWRKWSAKVYIGTLIHFLGLTPRIFVGAFKYYRLLFHLRMPEASIPQQPWRNPFPSPPSSPLPSFSSHPLPSPLSRRSGVWLPEKIFGNNLEIQCIYKLLLFLGDIVTMVCRVSCHVCFHCYQLSDDQPTTCLCECLHLFSWNNDK